MDGEDKDSIRDLYDQFSELPQDYIPEWADNQGVVIAQMDDLYLVNVTFYETNIYTEYHILY